ncbi:3-carboxy-cis,cis-muconate cycloisomerase [Actibacterium ureilyticum]|uniref:3-carboxy-cis,cis-muconate cycloisomerase n=1 Tax=Actibacterium ureilyticum TaxID=1590614 RepID=UPI000BAAA736|nr:3-carboxy-cis,cis-muconate cycloisomerase [Actibacterium ureilyticum]
MIPALEQSWLWGLIGDDDAAAIWSPDRQIQAMLRFEAALTRAMGAVGQAAPDACEAVAWQIDGFSPDMGALSAATGGDGLPVPELIRQLRGAVGQDAKLVHTGATSQDVIDTATVLILRDMSDLVAGRLAAIAHQVEALEQAFGANPLMGRTRMQAALPMQVADRLAPWRIAVEDHIAALRDLRPGVELLQLGGAVGNRAGFGDAGDAIAADMARQLGLGDPARAWHVNRAPIVAYGGLMAAISGSLGKIGQDIALMTQQGIDAMTVAGGGGSSAMPHKQNPILAELLVTLARFNAGQIGLLHQAMIHEQDRSGSAWTLEWLVLPQICMATARGLSATETLLSQVTSIGDASGD